MVFFYLTEFLLTLARGQRKIGRVEGLVVHGVHVYSGKQFKLWRNVCQPLWDELQVLESLRSLLAGRKRQRMKFCESKIHMLEGPSDDQVSDDFELAPLYVDLHDNGRWLKVEKRRLNLLHVGIRLQKRVNFLLAYLFLLVRIEPAKNFSPWGIEKQKSAIRNCRSNPLHKREIFVKVQTIFTIQDCKHFLVLNGCAFSRVTNFTIDLSLFQDCRLRIKSSRARFVSSMKKKLLEFLFFQL